MATAFDESKRVLLPRWRESRRCPTGELATEDARRDFYDRDSFELLKQEWHDEGSDGHASELVGAAIVNGRVSEVRDAAEQLVLHAPPGSTLRRLAERAIRGAIPHTLAEGDAEPDHARARVKKLRRIIHEDPRNAIALVDLAREYAILGLPYKALAAMRTATALAPENRFVLRAACALYVHASEPDRAIRLLRGAANSRSDPWLMAAEIAASEVAQKTPFSMKPLLHFKWVV